MKCDRCGKLLDESLMQEVEKRWYCPVCASELFMKMETENNRNLFMTKTENDNAE